jgi:hypothetical protein
MINKNSPRKYSQGNTRGENQKNYKFLIINNIRNKNFVILCFCG